MNAELIRELEGEIPLLTRTQLRFLDDVNLVVENNIFNGDMHDDETRVSEIMDKVSAIEENLKVIIRRLKSGRNARVKFLNTYPKWKKVREDGIEKLKEITQSIQTDRFNCNISKLVGYCTSFAGGAVTVASAIAIPFTLGIATPLAIAGGVVTGAGCSTAIGTSVTEAVLLKKKVNEAQEIINKDKEYFHEMNNWLEHAAALQKALCEVLEIDIVKDIAESVKSLVEKGMAMKDDYQRMNYIERTLNTIMLLLPQNVADVIPILGVATIISVLVTLFLLLLNIENRLVFDCASITIRCVVGIASLVDDTFDIARVTSLFTSNAVLAKDIAKAVTRGAVAVLGMALDVVGITLTSIDIHNGSLSPEAEKIFQVSKDLEEEANILQSIYENLN